MATTVNGTIKDKGEAVRQKLSLTFKCLDGATVVGAALAIPAPHPTAKTDTSGNFSKGLAPGNYELWVGSVKYCTMAVPASGPVRLEDIADVAAITDINIYTSVLIRADDGQLVRLKIGVADGGGYTPYAEPVS